MRPLVLYHGRFRFSVAAKGKKGVQREEQLLPFQTTSLVGAKVLVLAPHPDDETIGCGGSLALHRAHGDPVKVLVLTDGALAEGPDGGGPDYIGLREQETRAALAVLRIEEVEFWRLPDRSLTADAATVARLVEVLEAYRPTLLYGPSPVEPHPDHAAAAQLVWSAMQQTDIPAGLCLYEVGLPIRPNSLVDITPVLAQKERALACYASQLKLNDYKSKILGLNRYRSYTLPAHVTHAEAFWRLTSEEARTTSLNLIRWQMAGTAETAAPPDLSLASIIVRTFNRPRFLRECLESILAQREGELSRRDDVIRSLEARLQAEADTRRRLEQWVERVTEILGGRLLQRFYDLRGRTITPQGSIKEKVYEWIKS